MRILYTITGLGLGGAETLTIDIANKMCKLGHSVAIMYLVGDSVFNDKMDRRILLLGLNMSKGIWGGLKAQLEARRFIGKFKPNVVHSHLFHANIFCRILRLHTNLNFIISTEHSKNIGGSFRTFLYRITDRYSDINTNVSQEATSFFIEKKAFSPLKTRLVYNGIDLNKFKKNISNRNCLRLCYNVSNEEFLFLNVGRLTEAKDQQNLIQAFSFLISDGYPVKLMIVGDGPLKTTLVLLAKKCNIGDRVIFVGACSDVVDYYNASDCFVLSSAWEGFGLVLAEAMACQLPVVTTNAGGCAEVVANTSYVVEVQDAQALYLKMKEIYLMDRAERNLIAENNVVLVQRFDINSICKEWLSFYVKSIHRDLL